MSSLPTNDHYFAVSADLIRLLQWMLEHEQEGLKRLVKKALDRGFTPTSMEQHQAALAEQTEEDDEGLKDTITQFFMLLETLLQETNTDHVAVKQLQRCLVPAATHVDMSQYDEIALARSLEKATTAWESNSKETTKAVLCRELLKQWHPQHTKKESVH